MWHFPQRIRHPKSWHHSVWDVSPASPVRRSLSSMICVRCQILEMFQEAGDPVGKPTKAPGTVLICCSEGVKRFWTCGTLSCDSTGSPQLSVVLMVSDYRITVISGDNLIAGALPVQPEATPLAATKTTVQMLRLTDLIRGFGEWCHHAVGYWMCSQNLKHGVRVLSSGWAARWRLCGGVLSLATLPVCLS